MPALDATITPGQLGHITDHETIAAALNAANATYVQVANRPISLREVAGIDWTGATSSQTVVQAAITAAGVGATIEMGRPGIIHCGTGLTLLDFQTFDGGGMHLGSGSDPASMLWFPTLSGSQKGITGAASNIIKNVQLRGPGSTGAASTVGFSSPAGSPRFENVAFNLFDTGVSLTGAYYSTFIDCEFSRNKVGLTLSGCYNLTLITPRFRCTYGASDELLGTGVDGAARGLSIFGGAIESFSVGVAMASGQHLTLDGVYFETDTTNTTAIGVSAYGIDKYSILAEGCFVYLNGCAYWIRADSATNGLLRSSGNHFVCPNTTAASPVAYKADGGTMGDVGPDNWSEVARTTASYISAAVAILPGWKVRWPTGIGVTGYAGGVSDSAPSLKAHKSQTLASNGAVTFDNTYSRHEITLQANATSSAFVTALSNQEVLVTWIQDVSGGHTYVWPTTCRFAGGSAPTDTTASTRTSVMFRYDQFGGKWKELYRAVAVP